MSSKKLIVTLLSVLVVIAAAGGAAYYFLVYSPQSSQTGTTNSPGVTEQLTGNTIQVSVKVDGRTQTRNYTISMQEGLTLFNALTNYANDSSNGFTMQYSTSDYGAYITSINGDTADSSTEYWEFEINGQPAPVGVSAYVVKSGDSIEFKLLLASQQ